MLCINFGRRNLPLLLKARHTCGLVFLVGLVVDAPFQPLLGFDVPFVVPEAAGRLMFELVGWGPETNVRQALVSVVLVSSVGGYDVIEVQLPGTLGFFNMHRRRFIISIPSKSSKYAL